MEGNTALIIACRKSTKLAMKLMDVIIPSRNNDGDTVLTIANRLGLMDITMKITGKNNLEDKAFKLIETGEYDHNLQNKNGDHEGDLRSPSCHTTLMYARRTYQM